MNKRSFIKLFSGTAAAQFVSPLMKLLPDIKLQNWAGNFEYGTENLYTANSVELARDLVSKQAKLKVLGTRHCFNKIADSTKQFLSMKPAEEMFAVNIEESTVTVDGSMTYGRCARSSITRVSHCTTWHRCRTSRSRDLAARPLTARA